MKTVTNKPTFNDFEEMIKHLVNNNIITSRLAKSQLNYINCGGGVFAEIRNLYKLDVNGDQYILK